MKKEKLQNLGKRALGITAIPLLFLAILLIVLALNGEMFFVVNGSFSLTHFTSFFSYAAVVILTTFALSINLGSGRFDFSLGSMATLSAVIAAMITYNWLGRSNSAYPWVMLLIGIIVGAVLGALSGILYVLVKLPPIITSLGVTLIYEGLIYIITGGKYLNSQVAVRSMIQLRNNWVMPIIIILVALGVIYYLYDCTKFGYEYKSLREGQKVSVNTGIKEIPNAIICYIVCGALMGVVGFLQASRNMSINGSVLNFGSISIMFTAFLPMFIGGFIGRFSNDKIGYVIGGFCMSMLNSAFALLNTVIDSSTQSIINALLLVVFLIFLNNEEICKDLVTGKLFKKWIKALKEKKIQGGVSE